MKSFLGKAAMGLGGALAFNQVRADFFAEARKVKMPVGFQTFPVRDKMGKDLLNFPLTVGVFGVLIAPMFAAVGALAAIVTECTITVEREVTDEPEEIKTDAKPL